MLRHTVKTDMKRKALFIGDSILSCRIGQVKKKMLFFSYPFDLF